ncbi:MAG: AAA family ATPase [Myxococcota bacterium]|nr:AAA family ATPase [Myxococcota bacterium]MDW8363750.1 AAA family ATPase [Myxococcales bacterium]
MDLPAHTMSTTMTEPSPPLAHDAQPVEALLQAARDVAERLQRRLQAAIVGRDAVIELVVVALLADGHVLLEDYPGSGKTTLARVLGESIEPEPGSSVAPFRRIQFTPDLVPSDITGTTVLDLATHALVFRRGPLFAHVVLADEINRTSPKVQSALLEAMAEKQVTVDEQTHALDELFHVIATQNPLDVAGTYPLPSPQLDRFLFKIVMEPIGREDELRVVSRYPATSLELAAGLGRVRRAELLQARATLREHVVVAPVIRESLVDLVRALRADARLLRGPSTRALVVALPALAARALLHGRDFVAPEDVVALARPLLAHRLEPATADADLGAIVGEHVARAAEGLARHSLRP